MILSNNNFLLALITTVINFLLMNARVAQLVELHVANVVVASSNLVSRSRILKSQPAIRRISFCGDVPKWLREGFAKPSFTGSNPVVASIAGVAKLVDARDLKSLGRLDHAGSSPAPGTL